MNFIDLKAQRARLEPQMSAAVATVMDHCQFIMGPEVALFEAELAEFGRAEHVLGCASGTDALLLPMMAWGIGPGDAVFCPSFTYCATAEAVALLGATPVFVDIDRASYNMDPDSLRRAILDVKSRGELSARAVITVDLFGQSADYKSLTPIIREHGLKLIADSAQGFGTTLEGHHPLHWADVTTTSFFPAKPLGCYGDGGAILTDDADIMDKLRSLRIHGMGTDKYDNVNIGLNSRLDTIQAAVLRVKLAAFSEELDARDIIAARYSESLKAYALKIPSLMAGVRSTWAQYTIEVPDPDGFAAQLREKNIPTARYYPKPVHMQTAYRHYPCAGNGLPHTEDCLNTVISLPMHADLDEASQMHVITAAQSALKSAHM